MPANRSENKLKVVKVIGGGSTIGYLQPAVNITTDRGVIVSLTSGNFVAMVSGQGTTEQRAYHIHDLLVSHAYATGVAVGWPATTSDVVLGHSGFLPANRLPPASGFTYWDGDNAITVIDGRFD